MIIVFTGNGKGKTTASLGQVVRVLGRGKKALMIQFIKGPWKSGEDFITEKIKNQKSKLEEVDAGLLEGLENLYGFEIRKRGLGFVGILGDSLPIEKHKEAAREALQEFRAEVDNFDFIALDELNVALSLGLLEVAEVLEALKDIPDEKLVLLTGRGAPQEIIDRADLATEMREIKHPFNDGKLAKIAVEF